MSNKQDMTRLFLENVNSGIRMVNEYVTNTKIKESISMDEHSKDVQQSLSKRDRLNKRLFITYIALVVIFIITYIVAINSMTTTKTDLVDNSPTVYTTDYGENYHRENCQYLYHSKYSCTVLEADSWGYTKCSVCRPVSADQYSYSKVSSKLSDLLSVGDVVGTIFGGIVASIVGGFAVLTLYPYIYLFKKELPSKSYLDERFGTVMLGAMCIAIAFITVASILGLQNKY